MTYEAERAALVASARETIARGSKSFALASQLFDSATRERVWLLYAWCRHCDDVCDGQTLGHDAHAVTNPAERIEVLAEDTEAAVKDVRCGNGVFEGLRAVIAECALPQDLLNDHLAGFAMDLEGWRPQTEEDLLGYCYRVAGAVGCMMAIIMGVSADEEETLNRASDLGIAFQLGNIARDIVDDLAVDRCYLPATWLDEFHLKPGELAHLSNRPHLALLAQRLVRMSIPYEASGRIGAAALPFRSRWAVLAAAGVYGSIGRLVAERGEDAWVKRVTTGPFTKITCCVRAFFEACHNHPGRSARTGLWTRPKAGL